MGILTITYGVWNVSSKYEVCVRVTSNFLFYPFLPTTIVAVFFINFLCLSLTNVFLPLDSNGWCSQIDQYLNAGAFAHSHANCPDTPPLSIHGRRSIRTKRRNVRYRCLFAGILYVSFQVSNIRALVDIVVQRANIFVLSVKLVVGLGKVDLSPRLQW